MITKDRKLGRMMRKGRVRRKVYGSVERPRLSVFRSARHIYGQIVLDVEGRTLVAASTLKLELEAEQDGKSKIDQARLVGRLLAKRALDAGIKRVVFDRNGFLYHGRVKALADAAREGGLEF
ncbi:MAG: 50S ribosomal protein L18 [Pseudomonadota bacterium]